MHHCHNDHGLTIYSLPTDSNASDSSGGRLNKSDSIISTAVSVDPDQSGQCRKGTNNRISEVNASELNAGGAAITKDDAISNADGDSQHRETGSAVSDWEADDEYDDVAEVAEVSEPPPHHGNNDTDQTDMKNPMEADVEDAIKSPQSEMSAPEIQPVNCDSVTDITDTIISQSPSETALIIGQHSEQGAIQGTGILKPESTFHHRSRRGEYGRHETIADDDDDDDESDEESAAGSKVARSN